MSINWAEFLHADPDAIVFGRKNIVYALYIWLTIPSLMQLYLLDPQQ